MNELIEKYEIMTLTDGFLLGLLEFLHWSKWLLFAALILTITDLKFGVEKARYLKEEVRKSKAIRRTLQKICDYIMWVILSYTLGKAFSPFEVDMFPFLILLVIYGIEIESIFKNYFLSRGKNIKVNIFKFFSKKTDIIEIEENKDENKQEF